MSGIELRSERSNDAPDDHMVDMQLEVVVIPVSNVDRAKRFYGSLGWRLDADIPVSEALRIVQFTPPGSACSVQFGRGLTSAPPGSAQALHLVVGDLEEARDELLGNGVDASEIFHGNRYSPEGRQSGRDPEGRSYFSFVSFSDPDGNGWLLQEITARLPGRVDPGDTAFASAADLAAALRRAAAAHGEHEERIGRRDDDWPDWYATYMVAEKGGTELPT